MFRKALIRSASTYRSAVALKNIYPGSNLKARFDKSTEEPVTSGLKFNGVIPIRDVEIKTSLSSGPGGQNVNKVATKVDIRFHLESAKWLSPEVKSKLAEKLKNELTKDGFLITRSDRTRSQTLNRADAFQKLRAVIWAVLEEPDSKPPLPEEIQEMMRKGHLKATRERLREKRLKSIDKNIRKNPEFGL